MKKRYFKVLSFVLALMCFFTVANVNGLGYTYDHKGNVIYSTEGLTVNQTPYIYSDLGIDNMGKLNNPTDLFIYEHHFTREKIIYLLDGGNANSSIPSTLFVLNENLQKTEEYNYFIYDPADFTDEELMNIKSLGKAVVKGSSAPSTPEGTPEGGDENTGNGENQGGEGNAPAGQNEGDDSLVDENGLLKQHNEFTSVAELRKNSLAKLYILGANAVYRSYKRNSLPYTDYLYICDTGNNQVLVVDYESYDATHKTFKIVDIITSPKEELGEAQFRPSKTIVDAAGRIYVIATDVREGIMEFSAEGDFNRYIGTNYVKMSAWDIFWRNFSTESQLAGTDLILQTSFTGMAYKNNMIYATSYAIQSNGQITDDKNMIKKINPSGKDVLRRNGYTIPMGDFKYHKSNDGYAYNPSNLECIAVNEYGVYTVVDSNRDRLFTYDNEGNLLYISGGTGTQIDKISSPKAIQYLGENLLVLDSDKKAIIVFEPTDIAKVINSAIKCEYEGRVDDEYIDGQLYYGAAHYWEQVIELNANYEYAYVGIGKKYMNAKDYKQAMYYFELGFDADYYGKAYKQYRDSLIKEYFAPVAITAFVLITGLVIYKKIRRKKLGIKDEEMTGIGDE